VGLVANAVDFVGRAALNRAGQFLSAYLQNLVNADGVRCVWMRHAYIVMAADVIGIG
jgi:hypothetical protein